MENKKNLVKIFADVVSLVFNPALLGMAILLIGALRSEMAYNTEILYLISIVVLDGIIPGVIYKILLQKGYTFDSDLSPRPLHKNRTAILLIFLIVVGAQIMYMLFTTIYQPLLAILTGGFLAILAGLIISRYWKISMHASLVTIFVAMLIYLYGIENVWPTLFFIPLVFWARLALNRHTIWQLLAGFGASIIIVMISLYMYSMI